MFWDLCNIQHQPVVYVNFFCRSELEELELKVREERERYEEATHGNPDALTTVPPFSINDRFVLDKETSCYLLSIELVIPIEYIVLQVLFWLKGL